MVDPIQPDGCPSTTRLHRTGGLCSAVRIFAGFQNGDDLTGQVPLHPTGAADGPWYTGLGFLAESPQTRSEQLRSRDTGSIDTGSCREKCGEESVRSLDGGISTRSSSGWNFEAKRGADILFAD